MTELSRYISWKRDAIVLIAGILEIATQTCAAFTSSTTGGLPLHSPSSRHYSAVLKTLPVSTSGPYTTGLNGISLTPSFSGTYVAETSTSTMTQYPWTSSSHEANQILTSYRVFTNLNKTDYVTPFLSSKSHPVTPLTSLLTDTFSVGYTSSPGAYYKGSSSDDVTVSISAMSVSAYTSFTTSDISPTSSSMFTGNFATDSPLSSSFYSSLSLQSSVHVPLQSNNESITIVKTDTASIKSLLLASQQLNVSKTSQSQFSSTLLQTTNYLTSISISTPSPSVSKYSAAVLVTTVSPSQSLPITAAKNSSTTPKYSMVIKPPPLRTVTVPTTTPAQKRCKTGSCCTYGLSQLPPYLNFEESTSKGFVLAELRDIFNVNFTVNLLKPQQLVTLLKDSFNITTTSNGYNLVLSQEIDLEELYDKTDGKIDVHSLQLLITCSENSSFIVPPRVLNVTVEDVDDSMPVFSHSGTGSDDCVVPVYRADTSEDYMGELDLKPGKIKAVDGDVTTRHNISYKVLHSEPADYHVYFSLHSENGTVHKTKSMNSSDPSKYVIFVQAVEDSPQQKSRVAVLSIVVVAPSDPFTDPNKVNPTAKLAVQITCALVLMGFICGFVVIIHHRYTLSRAKVNSWQKDEERDMKLPKLAVYQSSSSSLNSAVPDVPTIASPSQIAVASTNTLKPEWRPSESQKKQRRLVVKKPLDTKSRPSWNAPAPKPRTTRYNPLSVYRKTYAK